MHISPAGADEEESLRKKSRCLVPIQINYGGKNGKENKAPIVTEERKERENHFSAQLHPVN
jgi:hypothetical protein